MMRITISILLSIHISVSAIGQSFNKEITENDTPTLVGKINKEALMQAPYTEWFLQEFNEYNADVAIIEQLSHALEGITITTFMGTWCGDSKKEIPRFYKILEATKFPLERLTLIGVRRNRDFYKQSPGGEEKGLNIHRVPTFIFYKDGKEINRIVESPVISLEKDMLQLLQSNYTSSYNIVSIVNKKLHKMGLKKFNKKLKRIAKEVKNSGDTPSALNTYSSVLYFSGKKDEAILVSKLNTLAFPKDSRSFEVLATRQYKKGHKVDALKNFKKANKLDPENKRVIAGITMIEKELL